MSNVKAKIFLSNVQQDFSVQRKVLKLDKNDSWTASSVAMNRQSFRHPKVRPNYMHMYVGIGTATIMLLIYFSLHHVLNEPALISITIFNFLFVFLLFPLEGQLFRKVYLLVAGNIVGLVWHFIKSSFGAASVFYLGADTFRIIIVVIGPIIDLIWIVSVWSLSLSVLASAKRRNEGDGENI